MAKTGSYVQRVIGCDCLTEERKGYIASALLHSEDFPDGAFHAYMDEMGIDVSELVPFSEGHMDECHAAAPEAK